jgi:hypothetical protein
MYKENRPLHGNCGPVIGACAQTLPDGNISAFLSYLHSFQESFFSLDNGVLAKEGAN